MVEMKKTARTAVVLLALCFISTQCADSTTECTTGSGCFPYGPIPDDVQSTDLSYYCCPQKNMTRHSDSLPDKSINCSCVLDLNLESKTAAYAWRSNGGSRMCSREGDCKGLSSSSSVNDRFKYCCYKANGSQVAENITATIFDGDKDQFIVCRCQHLSLPTPDPKAYVVPPVPSVNSTGEMCSYDAGCQEIPIAKCPGGYLYNVTFCCYGSRGLVTQNEANNFTRCTCTNDVYGGQCEARPIPIHLATVYSTTECTTGSGCFPYGPIPDDVQSTDLSYYCCPQKNMTRHSDSLPDKSINCSCVLDLNLESKTAAYAWRSNGGSRMCSREGDCKGLSSSSSVNDRFKYCCYKANGSQVAENITATIFDGDKDQFIVCRCQHLSLPTPDPKAYVVPPVPSVNSTGEMCSYDAGCQEIPIAKCPGGYLYNVTFCCYGSRGLVTQNEANNFTRCTCTNDVYGGQCEARPIPIHLATVSCQTNCTNRTDEETCTDGAQATRCCPYNMAVVASQSEGNFTSCACRAQVQKDCGATPSPSSIATRASPRFSDLVSLMLAAFVVGQFGHDGFISLPSLSFFWK
ncbi:hypothetical protein ACOMHN_044566 [Nucella lapillus]